MKKQTAVEWLYTKLSTCSSDELIGNINNWFDQAKAIEKKQMFQYIKQTFVTGSATKRYFTEDFEKYYNDTYNTNTQ